MDDNQPLQIRSYQIVRKLGEGGMGAVYEGFNPQLGRRAAIKVLLSQFTNDKEQVARFFNEAKASNLVRHPSLVDVFECGYAENGMAFIIMEYLDGETLRARCKRQGTLGPASIPIIRQMATALAATHEKNIVHRDLKPDKTTPVEKWQSFFLSPIERAAEVFVTHLCWAKPPTRSCKQAHCANCGIGHPSRHFSTVYGQIPLLFRWSRSFPSNRLARAARVHFPRPSGR